MSGVLYIVSTSIGNLEDITLRALRVLREADLVFCEELKPARKLLKQLEVGVKPLFSITEHNENEVVDELCMQMAQHGKKAALISDCGTPVFSDPGAMLIERALEYGIAVIPVPGASSLTAALSLADRKLDQFLFGGFLPRDKDMRLKELQRLQAMNLPVILMDTPYRLGVVLTDCARVFGKGRQALLACDLTTPKEKIIRGTLGELSLSCQNRKAEFMLIIYQYQRFSYNSNQ